MTVAVNKAIEYAHAHNDQFLKNLKDLVCIPSISTSPENKMDVERAANWLASKLTALGFSAVKVYPTKKHPIVFGESMQAGKEAPAVLIYGHYDVQPPEPLSLWKSQPFLPEIREDRLFGRGASDMKGQIIASLAAVESILRNSASPVNFKFLLEGEEEIGSPSLTGFIQEHTDLLKCDMVLNPDTGMIGPDTPSIIYSLRGLAYFEIRVYGPEHDLHSGSFGGVVHNPAQVLCDLIAGMHNINGQVTLPGFYDRVRSLDAAERAQLARLPLDENFYIKQTGAPALWGEKDFTPVERIGARPTLEVNGILSGFTGGGSKTVIPAFAMAKISMRLVADQDPEEVHLQLLNYLEQRAPKSVRYEVISMSGGPACYSDPQKPATQALARSLEKVWGKTPLYKREGGSVPVVAAMQQILGVDSVLSGFGLPDDNIHAPNEKLDLATWRKGIDALIYFFNDLREVN